MSCIRPHCLVIFYGLDMYVLIYRWVKYFRYRKVKLTVFSTPQSADNFTKFNILFVLEYLLKIDLKPIKMPKELFF